MKKIVYTVLLRSGLIPLYIWLNRYKVCILMGHGVMDRDVDSSWSSLRDYSRISRRQLERVVCILSKYYTFVSLDEATEIIAGNSNPPGKPALAFTFDDGYRNNLTRALPILRKYNVPATFYLTTAFVGRNAFYWFDRMDYVLQRLPAAIHTIKVVGVSYTIDATSQRALVESYSALRGAVRKQCSDGEDVQRRLGLIIDQLENMCGESIFDAPNSEWYSILSWDDVKTMSNDVVSIGSHTVDHMRIAECDRAFVLNQLIDSKLQLEKITGKECRHFCYPEGNYSHDVFDLVKKAGYVSATTVEEDRLNRVGENLMALKRTSFPSDDTKSDAEILAYISGFSSFLSSLLPN